VTKAKVFESWKTWAEAVGEFMGNARRLNERTGRLAGVDETRLGKGQGQGLPGDRPPSGGGP